MTLAQLHDIIQIVMGWTDLHLHAFTIDGKLFASNSQEIEGTAPESRFRLSSLDLQTDEAMFRRDAIPDDRDPEYLNIKEINTRLR